MIIIIIIIILQANRPLINPHPNTCSQLPVGYYKNQVALESESHSVCTHRHTPASLYKRMDPAQKIKPLVHIKYAYSFRRTTSERALASFAIQHNHHNYQYNYQHHQDLHKQSPLRAHRGIPQINPKFALSKANSHIQANRKELLCKKINGFCSVGFGVGGAFFGLRWISKHCNCTLIDKIKLS